MGLCYLAGEGKARSAEDQGDSGDPRGGFVTGHHTTSDKDKQGGNGVGCVYQKELNPTEFLKNVLDDKKIAINAGKADTNVEYCACGS